MDSTQLLLSVAITLTTIVIIVIGLQIIGLIKDIRRSINHDHKETNSKNEIKKITPKKSLLSTLSLLDKINNISLSHKEAKKKFFVKKT